MDMNLGQREYILEMLLTKYTIPEDYKGIVKEAINKYSTRIQRQM